MSSIFPLEQNALPWHSRPVAATGKPETLNTGRTKHFIANETVLAACHKRTETDPIYDLVQIAKQIELQPSTQSHVLASTQVYVSFPIEPIHLARHTTLASQDVFKISVGQPFYYHVSNSFNCIVRMPEWMIVPQTTTPPHATQAPNKKVTPIETFEVDSSP